MRNPHNLEWIMDNRMYWILLDGRLVASGPHDMDFEAGHLYITDFNSTKGDVDTIDSFEIRR